MRPNFGIDVEARSSRPRPKPIFWHRGQKKTVNHVIRQMFRIAPEVIVYRVIVDLVQIIFVYLLALCVSRYRLDPVLALGPP